MVQSPWKRNRVPAQLPQRSARSASHEAQSLPQGRTCTPVDAVVAALVAAAAVDAAAVGVAVVVVAELRVVVGGGAKHTAA